MKFPDTIYVRNNGGESFRDRYDGEPFEIKPGQAVQLHQGCAELVFGFGQEDKLRCLRRLGWVETNGDLSKGIERLNAFTFHESEKAANDHRARKPTAPADGKVGAEPEGRQTPSGNVPAVNLLDKLATVSHAGA